MRLPSTNIINNKPVRAGLFTLIIDTENSNDAIIKLGYENNNLFEYLTNSDFSGEPFLLFPEISSQLNIDSREHIHIVGNKKEFLNSIKGSRYASAVDVYDWRTKYRGEPSIFRDTKELLGISRFKTTQDLLYRMDDYLLEFQKYIKEYFFIKTNKKQFAKGDLENLVAGLFFIYIDMTAQILSMDTVESDRTNIDPKIQEAREGIINKRIPLDAIIPIFLSAQVIPIKDISDNQPILQQMLINGIQVLYKKFNGNLSDLEHIINFGYKYFLKFLNNNSKFPDNYPYLMSYYDGLSQYNVLLGVRVLSAEGILAYHNEIYGKTNININ